MKNILTILVAVLIAGALGYWVGQKQTVAVPDLDTNSVTLKWSSDLGKLSGYPVFPIDSIKAKTFIDNFYKLAATNPKTIVDKMPFSYAIDNKAIGKIFQGANAKSNIRLYPALNDSGEITLVVALEDENGKIQMEKLWDYIDPCPDDCPPILQDVNGKPISNDFYTCDEWNVELGKLGMTPKKSGKQKPAIQQ
jgi:hypothetical protein